MPGPQKVPKLYFQSQFSMSKINWIFSSKNINLGDHFLLKTFFLDSIFEPLYFLELCPIFDELTFLVGIFKSFFVVPMLIFGQKSDFFGPTVLKISQPNCIYYGICNECHYNSTENCSFRPLTNLSVELSWMSQECNMYMYVLLTLYVNCTYWCKGKNNKNLYSLYKIYPSWPLTLNFIQSF